MHEVRLLLPIYSFKASSCVPHTRYLVRNMGKESDAIESCEGLGVFQQFSITHWVVAPPRRQFSKRKLACDWNLTV